LGLSQGGHVAPFAASLDRKTAFVVSVSAAATDLAEQMRHEMRNTFRQAGLPEAGVEAGMRIQDLAESYVRTGEWEPYAQALQIASQTELAPVAAGFPQTEDSWVWNWVRRVAHSDPIPFWRQVPAPILVAYGSEDEQDNVPVAESVRRLEVALEGRAAPWKVRVFEGSGHALYEPEGDGHVIRRDFLELAAETIHSRPSPRHRE
jgi:hypothetical protein